MATDVKSPGSWTPKDGQKPGPGSASEQGACARGSGPEGGRRGGAACLCMRTKTHRRKWCQGSGGVKTFPGGGGRGGRRRSWTGGGGGDSGGAGRGLAARPGAARQDWGGRPHSVAKEGDGRRRLGGRGARGPVRGNGG